LEVDERLRRYALGAIVPAVFVPYGYDVLTYTARTQGMADSVSRNVFSTHNSVRNYSGYFPVLHVISSGNLFNIEEK
jgi:hypothetical protein